MSGSSRVFESLLIGIINCFKDCDDINHCQFIKLLPNSTLRKTPEHHLKWINTNPKDSVAVTNVDVLMHCSTSSDDEAERRREKIQRKSIYINEFMSHITKRHHVKNDPRASTNVSTVSASLSIPQDNNINNSIVNPIDTRSSSINMSTLKTELLDSLSEIIVPQIKNIIKKQFDSFKEDLINSIIQKRHNSF